ncbi:MAG: hypothetical protein P1V97_01225 [Planctomycetota bacterium]|nr:hypothetical protein [Planctomycetota bacterium]
MRRPSFRQAFTLIELVTYISLVSVSLTLLLSFEIATQKAVRSQSQSCDIAAQSNALYQQLSSDVTKSGDLSSKDNGRGLSMRSGDTNFIYTTKPSVYNKDKTMLVRQQKTTGAKPFEFEQPFPRLSDCKFKVKRSKGRALVEVTAKFRRASLIDPRVDDYITYHWVFETLVGERR